MIGLAYLKGHGTENDFVLLPDPDGRLVLSADTVRRICDRRAGLGADGILRIVPAALIEDGAPYADSARWFMDYRNADGSVAEMCGNGARVYARYLLDAGLTRPGQIRLATRGGIREVDVEPDGDIAVNMGPALVGDPVDIDGAAATFVDMGNPHAVVPVPSVRTLGRLEPSRTDLNVEYVEEVADGHLRMRVHERGVGETRSCGTGACAAVVATALRRGTPPGTPHLVDVPGGRLTVIWRADGSVRLAGPAVLVASGTLRADWLAAAETAIGEPEGVKQ